MNIKPKKTSQSAQADTKPPSSSHTPSENPLDSMDDLAMALAKREIDKAKIGDAAFSNPGEGALNPKGTHDGMDPKNRKVSRLAEQSSRPSDLPISDDNELKHTGKQ